MASPSAIRPRFPVPLLVSGVLLVVASVIVGVYLAHAPANTGTAQPSASAEAKAYLPNLRLSDVTMNATENFMKQQVVEIQGNIANMGPRSIQSITVVCYFAGVNGGYVHQESVPIVQSKGSPLKPSEIRKFRLPFDSLPDTWNQALPRIVIGQITFAR